ncbi:MAG: AAA family ATPase [Gammaproteobacteria bacterium]|nr:AAA family ATPase [Gammaproteobacteria bacterium]
MTTAAHSVFAKSRHRAPVGQTVAPRPTTIAETGLSEALLAELILKHLYEGGVLTLEQLVARIRLPGTVLEQLITFMRREARIEIRAGIETAQRFAVTDKGRAAALEALARSGYVGPAPVPLELYRAVSAAQTIHRHVTDRATMATAFEEIVLAQHLVDQLGAAMNSGRAIFIYGPAGTGKTYITRRLAHILPGSVLVPYAVSIGEIVLEVFDPVFHKPVRTMPTDGLALNDGNDTRFVDCQRPVAFAGGELRLDMLEVQYDPAHKTYRAPLQFRANNGLLIIDDMGRQLVQPEELLNRWIVPLEEARDYLHIGNGRHFAVPFDVIVVFSTNLNPVELADEAFLRRIGYKIRFDYLSPAAYAQIWRQVCTKRGVHCDPELVRYTIDELHHRNNMPLLPCHPRDLLGMAIDYADYIGTAGELTSAHIDWAWDNYFVPLNTRDQWADDPQRL